MKSNAKAKATPKEKGGGVFKMDDSELYRTSKQDLKNMVKGKKKGK